MIYAEALERQISFLRYFSSPKGSEALRRHYGGEGATWVTPEGVNAPVTDATIDDLREGLVTQLTKAEPFWWSPELTRLAAATAETIPSWTLTATDWPAAYGFFWFAEPIPTPWPVPGHQGPADCPLRALSWEPLTLPGTGAPFVQFWYWMGTRNAVYPAAPTTTWNWFVGEALEVAEQRLSEGSAVASRVYALCRLTAACWALLAQTLFVAPKQRADRAAAKRLKREGYPHEPLIRVVELRRVEHQAARAGEPEPVEWSCRWIVRGHWRQQPYGPGQAQRRPTWIAPHVKGPEDQPLKAPRATVFAVRR